ncbi:MAG: response regulator [Myxococcota bacterium]|nr:response regulator [Myxococcota bacterium]
MPGEDGYSLIRRIRALPATKGGAVPAVAISGFAGIEDRNRALDAGFQKHLAKPVKAADLLATVAHLSGATAK